MAGQLILPIPLQSIEMFMKPILQTTGRLGKSLFFSFLVLVPILGKATISTYVSPANVAFPPQVDATNFYNAGTWNLLDISFTPYETFHTLNYYNKGLMQSAPGWEFDLGPLANGGRGWSSTFTNDNSGAISGLDGLLLNPLLVSDTVGSYLLISATNIINKGSLSATANGEIILHGSNIALNRSPVGIQPIVATGSSNGKAGEQNDTAVYNEYWAQTNITFNSQIVWNGFMASSPLYSYTACGGTGNDEISINPVLSDSIDRSTGVFNLIVTNNLGMPVTNSFNTNEFRQAVFIYANPNNGITVSNRFTPSSNKSNLFVNVAALFSAVTTNTLTRLPQTNTLYLIDSLAASVNAGLLPNTNNGLINPYLVCQNTARPRNYILSRIEPALTLDNGTTIAPYSSGFTGNGTPPPDFYYMFPSMQPFAAMPPLTNNFLGFSNAIVTAKYAAYEALIQNLALDPAQIDLAVSNTPGKINIYANNLDLTQARLRAEGEIIIQASNLISSAGATIDCQNLSYNLGSTNGFINITNLIGSEVSRFGGTIRVWSGVWSNSMTIVSDNYAPTNTGITNPVTMLPITNYVYAPVTNSIQYNLAATIIDGSGLYSLVPVSVQDFILHSTNAVISDSITMATTNFYVDSKALTILGSIFFGEDFFGNSVSWSRASLPNLKFFTNNGTLYLTNSGYFGTDTTNHYSAFVNRGEIIAGSQDINSDYVEINGGYDFAESAEFSMVCRTGLVMNAYILASDDILFTAGNLVIDPSFVEASGSLNFTVSNLLSDAGYGSSNYFSCQNGFNLFIKPTFGDLLGTTIDDFALDDQEVDHIWAAKDLGASVVGYTNNVALGTLSLDQENPLFEPLFHFTGANAANGLYVSNLNLSTLTDYTNEIQIDPNITIYYISATLNTSDPNVVIVTTPEDFLDGQFGGHLRHVSGVTSLSQIKMSGAKQSGGQFQLSVINLPLGQTNIVQASTNMINWIPIYTNLGTSTILQFMDPKATNYPSRFYRIIPKP
jgi:hypothetical protein